ncbi:MAG: ACP phosphodiesterase [Halofilum sp. (in: g-proteobacteria)]|nr:ACP phosphodiesterase [Halofilum sp. (in: g-proteobacteria)]
MNYLAHLLLADDTPESILGNFLGDFVKGRPEGRYPDAVVAGIRLHRRVDVYTDGHSRVCTAVRRVAPERRRFAGIAVDMAFDHFLARDWQARDADGFAAFRRRVYDVLNARAEDMPERAQRMLPSFTGDDWLASYADFHGICFALARMSRRLSRPNALAETSRDLDRHYRDMEADLAVFWPDVQAFARTERQRLDNS